MQESGELWVECVLCCTMGVVAGSWHRKGNLLCSPLFVAYCLLLCIVLCVERQEVTVCFIDDYQHGRLACGSVCLRVHMLLRACVSMCACVCVCEHACICVICMCVHLCMCTCVYGCMYIIKIIYTVYIYIYIYIYVCVCVCANIAHVWILHVFECIAVVICLCGWFFIYLTNRHITLPKATTQSFAKIH